MTYPGQLYFHGADGIVNTDPDSYLGSPMYEIVGIHVPALLALGLLAAAFGLARLMASRGNGRAGDFVTRYDALNVADRTLLWLVSFSGAAHLAIVPTHFDSFYALLYLVGGIVMVRLAAGFWRTGQWSRWLRPALVGSVLGYMISSMLGEAPDQVGLIVKLAELTALSLAYRPVTSFRRAAASTWVVTLFVLTAAGAWAGAFQSGDGGHHLGETPPPGVLLPPGEDRDPTAEEQALADQWFEEARVALAKYEDVAVAAADGFDVDGLAGNDFHAENEARKNDGHIFEPGLPETLVYAVAPSGEPVLLGAMFQMDEIGQVGPAVGGPLTVWHAHDHLCFSLTPPALAGLTGPWGTCPLGSLTMPITNEMIHIWTIPGAPDKFGELPDEWLTEALSSR